MFSSCAVNMRGRENTGRPMLRGERGNLGLHKGKNILLLQYEEKKNLHTVGFFLFFFRLWEIVFRAAQGEGRKRWKECLIRARPNEGSCPIIHLPLSLHPVCMRKKKMKKKSLSSFGARRGIRQQYIPFYCVLLTSKIHFGECLSRSLESFIHTHTHTHR